VRVVVAATADVAIPTLQWLENSKHEILRTVTTADSKKGRGKVLTPSAIFNWSAKNGVRCLKPESEDEMVEAFSDADVVITIAYGKIIPERILNLPRFGFLNLHFSLLPAYRGAAPVQRAIRNGEKKSGISIFRIDKNLDTGPIYSQKEYLIPEDATSEDVLQALSHIGSDEFSEVFALLEQGVAPTAQSTEGVSIAPKISKEEAKISWSNKGLDIINAVRAFTPNPGSWTLLNGGVLKILKVQRASIAETLQPGQIHIENRRIFVGCKDSALEILTVLPSGKKEMNSSDWLNGARLVSGEYFE
jgi:methionyl-tRNA formyltransferase